MTRSAERLPRGVWSSTVIGMTAAALAWELSASLPALTTSYTRLDQLTALLLGAVVGAAIIGAREHRRRRSVWIGMLAGVLLGGVGALAGASIIVFAHGIVSPRWFAVERVAAWLFTAIGASALLNAFAWEHRFRWVGESAAIAAIGGATAGAIFTLPGAADAWQGVACVWFGGAIAFAVSGPELWHARAVIELAPARDGRWNPLAMREWPLHDGAVLALGEAQVGCERGTVTLYPPGGGVVANGHAVRHPREMNGNALIAVGRARYHLQLLQAP